MGHFIDPSPEFTVREIERQVGYGLMDVFDSETYKKKVSVYLDYRILKWVFMSSTHKTFALFEEHSIMGEVIYVEEEYGYVDNKWICISATDTLGNPIFWMGTYKLG